MTYDEYAFPDLAQRLGRHLSGDQYDDFAKLSDVCTAVVDHLEAGCDPCPHWVMCEWREQNHDSSPFRLRVTVGEAPVAPDPYVDSPVAHVVELLLMSDDERHRYERLRRLRLDHAKAVELLYVL